MFSSGPLRGASRSCRPWPCNGPCNVPDPATGPRNGPGNVLDLVTGPRNGPGNVHDPATGPRSGPGNVLDPATGPRGGPCLHRQEYFSYHGHNDPGPCDARCNVCQGETT